MRYRVGATDEPAGAESDIPVKPHVIQTESERYVIHNESDIRVNRILSLSNDFRKLKLLVGKSLLEFSKFCRRLKKK